MRLSILHVICYQEMEEANLFITILLEKDRH